MRSLKMQRRTPSDIPEAPPKPIEIEAVDPIPKTDKYAPYKPKKLGEIPEFPCGMPNVKELSEESLDTLADIMNRIGKAIGKFQNNFRESVREALRKQNA